VTQQAALVVQAVYRQVLAAILEMRMHVVEPVQLVQYQVQQLEERLLVAVQLAPLAVTAERQEPAELYPVVPVAQVVAAVL